MGGTKGKSWNLPWEDRLKPTVRSVSDGKPAGSGTGRLPLDQMRGGNSRDPSVEILSILHNVQGKHGTGDCLLGKYTSLGFANWVEISMTNALWGKCSH